MSIHVSKIDEALVFIADCRSEYGGATAGDLETIEAMLVESLGQDKMRPCVNSHNTGGMPAHIVEATLKMFRK